MYTKYLLCRGEDQLKRGVLTAVEGHMLYSLGSKCLSYTARFSRVSRLELANLHTSYEEPIL